MAKFNLVAGSFSSFYVGQAAASSTPLTQVNVIGTGGYTFSFKEGKQKWIRATNSFVPSELPTLTVTLTFISDDPQAANLCMSNWLTDTQDQPPRNLQYSVLMWDAINTNGSSVFIPICESVVNYSFKRNKKEQTEVPLTLIWTGALGTQMFYKRSNSQLITQMAAQSPF